MQAHRAFCTASAPDAAHSTFCSRPPPADRWQVSSNSRLASTSTGVTAL